MQEEPITNTPVVTPVVGAEPASQRRFQFNKKPSRRVLTYSAAAIAAAVVITVGLVLILGNNGPHGNVDGAYKETAIMYVSDEKGFEPATLHVTPRTRVYFNESDSNVHSIVANGKLPDNTFGLTSKNKQNLISDQQEETGDGSGGYHFTFYKAGVYTFHDQNNPTNNGQIIVSN